MGNRFPGRVLVAIVTAAIVILVAFGLAWAALPEEGHGPLLFLSIVAALLLYAGLYVAQRRRHW